MPVEFPEMRRNGKDALEGLADGQWAARNAHSPHLAATAYYQELANALNILDDMLEKPYERIGTVLLNEEEAALVQAVYDAWDQVVDETRGSGGSRAPDHVHYAAPSWPALASAARKAHDVMHRADQQTV